MRLLVPGLLILAAWLLLFLGIEPVPTWFYVFAWYPTIVLLDQAAHRIDGRPTVLSDWRRIVSLFGWSAIIWLVFEAANFRLANWYYVFLPRPPVERWAGVLLSFATVVPALIAMARFLDAVGKRRELQSRPLPLPENQLWVPVALGGGLAALALLWPRTFFPLIWGAAWLLLEPFVYRRRPEASLFADLARGDWRRTVRLLVAGFLVGVLWETYNFWARGKWVYTVPWIEHLKVFEMPPLGFLGFPFFALEAWAMYQALVVLGVAAPVEIRAAEGGRGQPRPAAPGRLWPSLAASALAALFAGLTLLGMDRWTISSVMPRLGDLPSVQPAQVERLEQAGIHTPFQLAALPAESLMARGPFRPNEAVLLTETARLVTFRGIGVRHARRLRQLGIFVVCSLAAHRPDSLWRSYHADDDVPAARLAEPPPLRPTEPEVRVWVGAARQACTAE